MSGGPGQDAAETPAAQNRVQDGVETRTESPPPSIGELPDLAQHERVREMSIQETSLLPEIRGVLKGGTGSGACRTQAPDVSEPL